jgi:hypothetical protein
LTVTKDFFTVTNPQTGEAIRRVPLCGASEAAEAVQAAQAAQPAGPTWACRRAASAWASWPMNSTATPATSPSCWPGLRLRRSAGRGRSEAAVAALRGASVGQTGVIGVVLDAGRRWPALPKPLRRR